MPYSSPLPLSTMMSGNIGEELLQKKFSFTDTVMSKKHCVRFATQDDLSAIAHVAHVTWDDTYNNVIAPENRREFLERAYKPENLLPSINASGHWFYVAELGHQVIGFGHFLRRYHPTQARAELVRLYVLPGYQNMFVGTTILETGFDALARDNIEQCFVSVQSSNKMARKFYERHGFKFHRTHGQFLGTQIITLVEYTRSIGNADIKP